jgi:DUF4097 and DUF4098 domain-containing protein YvlB
MNSEKSKLPRIIVVTLVLSFVLASVSGYAVNRARAEDPQFTSKIETALKKHYNTDVIRFNFDVNSTDEKNSVQIFKMPIQDITLSTTSGSIEIISVSDAKHVTIKSDGSESQVKLTPEKSLHLDSGDSFGSADILIELPADFEGRIFVRTLSGDIQIKDLATGQIQVETASGDIEAKNISAKKLILNSISGDINVTQKKAGEVIAKTISGEVELNLSKGSNGYNFEMNSFSGEVSNILANEPRGPNLISVTTTSGDINIK